MMLLVLSHFNYCGAVYSGWFKRVQGECLRFIFGLKSRQHASSSLGEISWFNLINRRYFRSLCFYFKILVTGKSAYLSQIRICTDVHTLNNKLSGFLSSLAYKTQFFKKSLCMQYLSL